MKITCTSVLDYIKRRLLAQDECDADCAEHPDTNAGVGETSAKFCQNYIKQFTKSATKMEGQSQRPCSCSELNINGRALHYVIRVDDRNSSLKFYTDIMGMKVLRNEEVKVRECKSDQPFQSKTIVGYGPEDNYFCLQLIYDCKKRSHLRGNECLGITVISSQALEQANRQSWPIHASNMLEAPDGLKIFIIDSPVPPKSDPIIKISLACTNLATSLSFWHGMLGLTLYQHCKTAKRAQVSFRSDEVNIDLRQVDVVVNRAQSFDRIVFSCPPEQLHILQERITRDFDGTVITPLTKQHFDGLKFIVLADPNGHEVCFVDDLKFRQISRLKPELKKHFSERMAVKGSFDPDTLKPCLRKREFATCRAPCVIRSGIPVAIPKHTTSTDNCICCPRSKAHRRPTTPAISNEATDDDDDDDDVQRRKKKERDAKTDGDNMPLTSVASEKSLKSDTSVIFDTSNSRPSDKSGKPSKSGKSDKSKKSDKSDIALDQSRKSNKSLESVKSGKSGKPKKSSSKNKKDMPSSGDGQSENDKNSIANIPEMAATPQADRRVSNSDGNADNTPEKIKTPKASRTAQSSTQLKPEEKGQDRNNQQVVQSVQVPVTYMDQSEQNDYPYRFDSPSRNQEKEEKAAKKREQQHLKSNEKGDKKSRKMKSSKVDDITPEDIFMDYLLTQEGICSCCPSDISSCQSLDDPDYSNIAPCYENLPSCLPPCDLSYLRNCLTSPRKPLCLPPPRIPIAALASTSDCECPPEPRDRKFDQHITLVVQSGKKKKSTVCSMDLDTETSDEAPSEPGTPKSATCPNYPGQKECKQPVEPQPEIISTEPEIIPTKPGINRQKPEIIPLISTMGGQLWSPITLDQLNSNNLPPPIQLSPAPMMFPPFYQYNPVPYCPPARNVQIVQPVASNDNLPISKVGSTSATSKDQLRRLQKQQSRDKKEIEKRKKSDRKLAEKQKKDERKKQSLEKQPTEQFESLHSIMPNSNVSLGKTPSENRRGRSREHESFYDARDHFSQEGIPVIQSPSLGHSVGPSASRLKPTPAGPSPVPQVYPYPPSPSPYSPNPYPHQYGFQPNFPALPYTPTVPYVLSQCPPQCHFPEFSPCAELTKFMNQRRDDADQRSLMYPALPPPSSSSPSTPPTPVQGPLYYQTKGKPYAERGPAKVVYKIDAGGKGKKKTLSKKPPPPPKKIVPGSVQHLGYGGSESAPVFLERVGSGKNAPVNIQYMANEVAPGYPGSSTSASGPHYTHPPGPSPSQGMGTVMVKGKGGKIKLINVQEEQRKEEDKELQREMDRLREAERVQDNEKKKVLDKQEKKIEKQRLALEKDREKLEKEKGKEAEKEKVRIEQEKLRMEKQKERAEREKQEEYEREKERFENEKKRVEKAANREREMISREKERLALEIKRDKIRQMQLNREKSRRLMEAARRLKAQEEAMSPINRVGFVSTETTNPHSQVTICEQNSRKPKQERDTSTNVSKLLRKAAQKLECPSVSDVCSGQSICNPDVDREAHQVSKLLREIAKSHKKVDQCIKRPVMTKCKKIGVAYPRRECGNSKATKLVGCTKQAYHVIGTTKLSNIKLLKKFSEELSTSSASLQAFGNIPLAPISIEIEKVSQCVSESPSWRRNLVAKYTLEGKQPSKIPKLAKNKLRICTENSTPIIEEESASTLDETLQPTTKKLFKQTLSALIKRSKLKTQTKVSKSLSPKKSTLEIIEEAMKEPERKVTINEEISTLPDLANSSAKSSSQAKILVHEAIAPDPELASCVNKNDQVTITVKEQGTNKELPKTVVNESTNINSIEQGTQDEQAGKVDKDVQEKTEELENVEKLITPEKRLPEVVRIVQYDSGLSSIDSFNSEIPSSSAISEMVITSEDEDSIREMVNRLKKRGILKRIDRHQHRNITREDIEKKIMDEAMARVTSNNDMNILHNISKSIAEKVASLTTVNIHKLLRKPLLNTSSDTIDVKPQESNAVKLESKTIEDLQNRLNNLEKNLPTINLSKQASKSVVHVSDFNKKAQFSQIITVNKPSYNIPVSAKESSLRQLGKESQNVQNADKAPNPANCRKYGAQVENAIKDTMQNMLLPPKRHFTSSSPEKRIKNFLQKRELKQIEERTVSAGPSPTDSVNKLSSRTFDAKLVVLESNIKRGMAAKLPSRETCSDFRQMTEVDSRLHTVKKTYVNASIDDTRLFSSYTRELHPERHSPKVLSRANANTSVQRDIKISPYLQSTLKRIYEDVNDIAACKRRGSVAFTETATNPSDHLKPSYRSDIHSINTRGSLETLITKHENIPSTIYRSTYDTPQKITEMVEPIQPVQKRSPYKQNHVSCSPQYPRSKIILQHPPSKSNPSVLKHSKDSQSPSRNTECLRVNSGCITKRVTINDSKSLHICGEAPRKSSGSIMKVVPFIGKKTDTLLNGRLLKNAAVDSRSLDNYVSGIGRKIAKSEEWIDALNKKTVEMLQKSANAVESIKRHSTGQPNAVAICTVNQQISHSRINNKKELTEDDRSSDGEDHGGNATGSKTQPRALQSFQAIVAHRWKSNMQNEHRSRSHPADKKSASTSPTSPMCRYSKSTNAMTEEEDTDEEEIKSTNLTDFPERHRQCKVVPFYTKRKQVGYVEYENRLNYPKIRNENKFESHRYRSRRDQASGPKSRESQHRITTVSPKILAEELRRRLLKLESEDIRNRYVVSLSMTRDISPSTTRDSFVEYNEYDE